MTCFLSVDAAAKLLHVTPRTVHNWERGTHLIPYAAFKLMRIMRGGQLPGEAWAGWHFAWNEVLISPEGHRFKPTEFSWLHLLIEQAKLWRKTRAEHYARAVVDAQLRQATEAAVGFSLSPAVMLGGVIPLSDEVDPYTAAGARLAPVAAIAPYRWRQVDGTQASFAYHGVRA